MSNEKLQKAFRKHYQDGQGRVFVKLPTPFKVGTKMPEDAREIFDLLEKLGLRDASPTSNGFRIHAQYLSIDFAQESFVYASYCFDEDPVESSDFLHEVRGLANTVKFGI